MGPSATYHPPKGEKWETTVKHELPLWPEPTIGYCSRRPSICSTCGSRFVGAREVGPRVSEQKPLGKNPSPRHDLPTYLTITLQNRGYMGLTLPIHPVPGAILLPQICWPKKLKNNVLSGPAGG